MLPDFKNKNIFITGHTGFKGIWLSLMLKEMGAHVFGYALPPKCNPIFDQCYKSVFSQSWNADIRNGSNLKEAIELVQPDVIFHLAAQPLVIDSYKNPAHTFDVNVLGTVHVLDAIREYSKQCAVIVITTDKVYENFEWFYPYRENDRLGGYDPYSSSKACAELVVQSYRRSFYNNENAGSAITVASVRAGNVIGGGDWADNRIIPDLVRAFSTNKTLAVRNPYSVRPWQHVLDALYGYLRLAEKLTYECKNQLWQDAWNFGPDSADNVPVKTVVQWAAEYWEGGRYESLPAQNAARHEAGLLRLDSSKANQLLNWKPLWNARTAVYETLEWYKKVVLLKKDPAITAIGQIHSYLEAAKGV